MTWHGLPLLTSVVFGALGLSLQGLLIQRTRHDLVYAYRRAGLHPWDADHLFRGLVRVLRLRQGTDHPVIDQIIWKLRDSLVLALVHLLVVGRSVLYLIFLPVVAPTHLVAQIGAWLVPAISVVVIVHTLLRLGARASAGAW